MNLSTERVSDVVFSPPIRHKLRYYPDPVLFQAGKQVVYGAEIETLAKSMLLTMVASGGIGLAANQIGYPLRMFVVDTEWPDFGGLGESKSYVFINPSIVSMSVEMVKSVEGCLSFPGEEQEVARAKSIVVRALDIYGEPFTLEADGILSVVIQHEYQHISGHTFVDAKGYLTRKTVQKNVQKRIARLRSK